MKKQLSDFIVMSDVDGTLVTQDEQIPERNLDAIDRFTKAGGRFALCTGRSFVNSAHLVAQLPVNFPCVLLNGGMLYDFPKQEVLYQQYLPTDAQACFPAIMERFPEARVMIVDREHYYEVSSPDNMPTPNQNNAHVQTTLSTISGQPWHKGIVLLEEAHMGELIAFLEGLRCSGIRHVNTISTVLEILPNGISKASGLSKLMELQGFQADNLAVIGDYYNDLEMIQLAGIGTTLSTAPQDLQSVADFVVGPCADGAVADLIEHLEALCQG